MLIALGGIEVAQRWARRRAGTVAFAVAREGRPIRGVAIHRRYYSASVVKAMLALAVLRAARDRPLTAGERALLRPMIVVSDNDAATAVYARVGAGALYAIARAARMTNSTSPTTGPTRSSPRTTRRACSCASTG